MKNASETSMAANFSITLRPSRPPLGDPIKGTVDELTSRSRDRVNGEREKEKTK